MFNIIIAPSKNMWVELIGQSHHFLHHFLWVSDEYQQSLVYLQSG